MNPQNITYVWNLQIKSDHKKMKAEGCTLIYASTKIAHFSNIGCHFLKH